MRKGEESKQRLIRCAAELFWKNGYTATGVSEILKNAELPKGSFYFYFKSKEELGVEVITYYQSVLLEKMRELAEGRDFTDFLDAVFGFLQDRTDGNSFSGCPFAVIGMETAISKPDVARSYLDTLKQFQTLFCDVLLQSGLSQPHVELLAERLFAIYQGNLLLGRIGNDSAYLERAKRSMIETYKEYRAYHAV